MTDKATEPPQAAPAVGAQVDRGVRPCAWAIFVGNGNARMWSTLQPHVQKLADAEGLEVTPLYDQAALDAVQGVAAGMYAAKMALLEAEIERLTAALTLANGQAERFERGWYLRGDALEKLQNWIDAYPMTVFPEPDFAKARALLQAGGITLDAINANNMRHVTKGVRNIVEEGLRA